MFNDVVEEADQDYTFSLIENDGSVTSNYAIDPDASTASVTIVDGNGGPGVGPTVEFSINQTELTEGGEFTINFNVDGDIPAEGVTVLVDSPTQFVLGEFNIFNDDGTPAFTSTGIAGVPTVGDIGASSFLDTITEPDASITISAFDDGAIEGSESISFSLVNGEVYEVDPNAGTVEFTLDDGGDDAVFGVESGVTSVFLDLPLLESAAGLTLVGADSDATPFSDDFQVGFAITDDTDFTFAPAPFTPLGGTIEHSGTITLGLGDAELTIGEFSIGFDPTRVSETTSGFVVADTLGLDVLFDLSAPSTAAISSEELEISGADLLLAPELAGALGLAELTGADVGDARIDALVSLTAGGPPNPGTSTDGDDELVGTDGNDFLDGLRGDDIYTGGAGADQFVFDLTQGVDTITDFEFGVDQISLGGLTPDGVKFFELGNDTLVLTNSNELLGVVQGVTSLDNTVFA